MSARPGAADPQTLPRPLHGVLFDLDGTLVDTAADIAQALNRALAEIGCAAVPVNEVRDLIGRGGAVLIARALDGRGVVTDAEGRDRLHDRFLEHYHALHHAGTSAAVAYPGALPMLQALRTQGLKLGVVTNKNGALARRTLEAVGLAPLFDLIVGGEQCERRKPHPEPLLYATRELGFTPGNGLMIGDSANDVAAARGAGMAVWCVPYGYNEGRDPRLLPCDGFIESLAELPDLLRPGRADPLGAARPLSGGPPAGEPTA